VLRHGSIKGINERAARVIQYSYLYV
jgi:hypothetical protein